jgi:hypothetical protein
MLLRSPSEGLPPSSFPWRPALLAAPLATRLASQPADPLMVQLALQSASHFAALSHSSVERIARKLHSWQPRWLPTNNAGFIF